MGTSECGDLEITDINRFYFDRKNEVETLDCSKAWLDTQTYESLLDAAQFIATKEKCQSVKIACPKEITYRRGYIGATQLEKTSTTITQKRIRKPSVTISVE